MADDTQQNQDASLRLPLGHERLEIGNRYEIMSIANDILIALFFVAGSVLFFFKPLETVAIWMFLLGSIQFLLRPVIRLSRRVHLRRLDPHSGDSAQDY